MTMTSSRSAEFIGRNNAFPPDIKKPQERSASRGFGNGSAFRLISLSIAFLPIPRLGFDEQHLEEFFLAVVREAGQPLLKWNDGGEFWRKRAHTG